MNKTTSLLVAFLSMFAVWQMGAQAGNTCDDPIVIESLPFNDEDDTANYTSVYDGVAGAGCGTISDYLSGREAIYAFTPEVSGEINVLLSPEDVYAGIFVYDSCANIGVACYADAYGYNGNNTADIEFIMPVERDVTYYFVLSVLAEGEEDSFPYELDITEVSCSRPALVAVESLGVGEATISWDGAADSFEYAYNTTGATPTSGTETTETEVNLTDLIEGETYFFFVRSVCEEGETSAWAEPIEFRVPGHGDNCEVALPIASLPFTTTDSTANYANEYSGTPGAACGGAADYLNGNNVVYTYTADFNGAVNVELIAEVASKGVFVYDSCDAIGVLCYDGAFEEDAEEDVNFTLYVTEGETYYLVLTTKFAGQTMDYELNLSAINCPIPGGIVLNNATPTTADFSWVSIDEATTYEYALTTEDTAPTTGIEQTTDTSMTLTDLAADTDYYFWLRAVCGTETTDWADSFYFFTGYCTPVYTSTIDYLSRISLNAIISNIEYTATSRPADGYANESDMVLTAYAGAEINLQTEYQGGANKVMLWLDSNNNMQFDNNELLYEGTNTEPNNGHNVEINIPQNIANGSYRMRVRSVYGSSPTFDACNSQTYGSTVDLTLEVVDAPTCPHVENIVLDAATPNSATISWDENQEAESYIIKYGEAGFNPETEGTAVEVTENTYTVDGLLADTNYDFYVRAVCNSDDVSFWGMSLDVFTGYCTPSYSSNSEYLTYVTTEDAFINLDYSRSSAPTGNYDNQAVQQVVVAPGMSFTMNTRYSSGSNTIAVWADWNRNMAFESNEKVADTYSSNNEQSFTIEVPQSVEYGEYRLRVASRWSNNPIEPCGSGYSYGTTVDFTIVVVEEPDCMPVENLTAESTSLTSIQIDWDGPDNATAWELEYMVAGDPVGTGVLVDVDTNSFLLEDLESNITYDIYVKPICDEGDEEALARMISLYLGYCYPEYSATTNDHITAISTEGALNDIDYSVDSRPEDGYDNRHDEVLTAFAGSSIDFSTSYQGGVQGIKVWADLNNNANFEDDEVLYFEHASGANQDGELEISANLEPGEYRLRFVSVYGSSVDIDDPCGDYTHGSTVDFTLEIVELDCMPATDITFAQDNDNNIVMSWTGNEDVAEWTIEYGESGFTPGEGTEVTTTEDSYLFNDLSINNEYDFYISGDCEDEEGITIGPKKFYYGYCTPSSNSEYTKRIQTYNAFEDIHYERDSYPEGGYDNVVDEYELVVIPGEEFSFDVEYDRTNFTTKIWVDWDKNLSFDSEELIFDEHTSDNTISSSMTLPLDTDPGTYQVRVRTKWGASDFGPCGHESWGSAVDITLIVIDAPTCLAPIDLEVVNTYQNAIELSWTDRQELADIQHWEIEYGPRDYTQGEGTIVQADENPYRVEGLESSTEYDFYIRAVCNEDDSSFWTRRPVSATTLCGPLNIPYVLDFETAVVPDIPYCTSQIVGTGSNAWVTEENPGYFWGNTTVLRYQRSDTNAADAWFFTQGVRLEAGVWYAVSYDYMVGNSQFAESLKVAMGLEPDAASMTTVIEDHPEISVAQVTQNEVEFQVPEDGVYYFGFHAYSDAAQFALFLDNIKVDTSLGVDKINDIAFAMYPNPADVEIYLEADTKMETIAIYNMLGQTVKQVNSNANQQTINVQDLQSGAYIIEVIAEGKRLSKQLIKK